MTDTTKYTFIETGEATAILPLLERIGASVRVHLERHGFYPAGGGIINVDVSISTEERGRESLVRVDSREEK